MPPDELAAAVLPRVAAACPQCGAACEKDFAEFSIAMSRSCFRFTSPGELAPTALYLVGFYGFSRDDFDKVHDFKRTESVAEFLRSIGVGAEA